MSKAQKSKIKSRDKKTQRSKMTDRERAIRYFSGRIKIDIAKSLRTFLTRPPQGINIKRILAGPKKKHSNSRAKK